MSDNLEVTPSNPFEAAVAAAEAELAADTPSAEEAPSTLPNEPDPVTDDAPESADLSSDDSGAEDTDEDEFDFDFGDEEEADESVSNQEPVTHEVPGIGNVPVDELVRGYLRESDYTKKTQEIANLRRQLEEQAEKGPKNQRELYEALKESPKETVAWLATQVGLLNAEDAQTKMREIEGIRLADDATVEQEVQSRLEQAVMRHPAVQDALRQKVVGQIEAQFGEIAGRVGKPLSDNAKQKLMDFAYENGISNLVVAYDALSARAQNAPKSDVRRSQPQKRTASKGRDEGLSFDGPVSDFSEAADRALAELRAKGVVE